MDQFYNSAFLGYKMQPNKRISFTTPLFIPHLPLTDLFFVVVAYINFSFLIYS